MGKKRAVSPSVLYTFELFNYKHIINFIILENTKQYQFYPLKLAQIKINMSVHVKMVSRATQILLKGKNKIDTTSMEGTCKNISNTLKNLDPAFKFFKRYIQNSKLFVGDRNKNLT